MSVVSWSYAGADAGRSRVLIPRKHWGTMVKRMQLNCEAAQDGFMIGPKRGKIPGAYSTRGCAPKAQMGLLERRRFRHSAPTFQLPIGANVFP